MQVVILAGGLATRLQPITERIPKAMVIIEGKPFLEYQIEFLKKNGITDLILCVGYLSEKIEQYFGNGDKFGITIHYVHDGDKLLGTAGALKRAESLLQKNFFVMYGDSYVFLNFKDLNSQFRETNKPAIMVVYKNNNRYDTSNVALENGKVIHYDKKNLSGDLLYIDYGVLAFAKDVLNLIPEDQVSPLEDVIKVLIRRKDLAAYEVTERFYEIGSHTGLENFSNYIKNQMKQVSN